MLFYVYKESGIFTFTCMMLLLLVAAINTSSSSCCFSALGSAHGKSFSSNGNDESFLSFDCLYKSISWVSCDGRIILSYLFIAAAATTMQWICDIVLPKASAQKESQDGNKISILMSRDEISSPWLSCCCYKAATGGMLMLVSAMEVMEANEWWWKKHQHYKQHD